LSIEGRSSLSGIPAKAGIQGSPFAAKPAVRPPCLNTCPDYRLRARLHQPRPGRSRRSISAGAGPGCRCAHGAEDPCRCRPRTQPYESAGALQSTGATSVHGLPPLPESILGSAFESGGATVLANHAYWTTGFIGAGPYKLDRWEPGSFIEASTFDRHVLGPAKIQRIKLSVIGDGNAVMASMLAGEVHF